MMMMMIHLSADANKHSLIHEKAETKQKRLKVMDKSPEGLVGQLVQVMM